MKSLISIVLISVLILSGCWAPAVETPTEKEKTKFIIDTYEVGKEQKNVLIQKTGRITASSSLTLTAQGAGEISKISVREWQSVKAGTVIATLKDTQSNYDLRFSQAQNTLKVQNATIETTRINLEQAVDNARIAFERARQSYETLTNKNNFAVETLINTNSKTLDSYNESYKTYLSDTERIMTQMLYEADKILGITTNFQYANDSWEPYLGTRVGNSKSLADNEWGATYALRWDLRARIEKTKTINLANPDEDFEFISKSYTQSRKLADAMLYMLQNSVVWGGLPQELLTGWVASWNGQRTSVQGSEWGYNTWRAQTLTFFKWYKNTELATKFALTSLSRPLTSEENAIINASNDLKVTYENARIDLKDRIENARLSLEQAEKAYNTAQALRDATLIQLDANKENAKIALAQAERDYAKLRVIAPVDGVISRVIANVGQSVNIGSQIAEFTSKQPQMVIDIEPNIVSWLAVGQSVNIMVEEKNLTGTIMALSSVANANLLSTVRIAVPDWQAYIWKSAIINFFPQNNVDWETILTLPLDSVSIISEGEWEIFVYTGTGISKKTVKIWKTLGDAIEINDIISNGTEIILTNMNNYDSNKQFIEKRSQSWTLNN